MLKKFLYTVAAVCLVFVFTGCTPSIQYEDFPDGVFEIINGGTYEFKGNYRGQIHIDARRQDIVLVFDNFNLLSSGQAAIVAPRSNRVEIILADGSENTVTTRSGLENTIDIGDNLFISGNGTLNVVAEASHGIRAGNFIEINSGTVNITTTNGNGLRGRDGVIINDGNVTIMSEGDGIRTTRDEPDRKGIVTINGGTINIGTRGDGIQSISDVTINGGDLTIAARDDGIYTGSSIIITGGVINILEAMEGIEGRDVTIEGGDITINANNDGINSRYPQVGEDGDIGTEPFIRMTGGKVQTITRRDSIESDGIIYFEGGTLHVSGITSGKPCGTIIISGGELVSTGNIITMGEQSTQPYISADNISMQAPGTLIEIKDEDGNVVLSFTAPNAFSRHVVFSNPNFIPRRTYSIYMGGRLYLETIAL